MLGPSPSATLNLEEAVARAATHDEVEGVLLLGSTASGDLTVASDFDVMVVLATGGEGREGLQVEITLIDGRLADILIVSFARLSAAVRGVDETDYRLAAWLTESVIAFDLGDIAGLRTSAARDQQGWSPTTSMRSAGNCPMTSW